MTVSLMRARTRATTRARRPLVGTALGMLAVGLTATAAVAQPVAAEAGAAAASTVVALDFGSGGDSATVLTNTGDPRITARLVATNGATVTSTTGPEGPGTALRFPAFNDRRGGPRAMIALRDGSLADGDQLAPGLGDFTVSVDLNLDAVSVGVDGDNGNNVVQRGLNGQVAQFKVDVDHGAPGCTVARFSGRAPSTTVVRATETVTPGQWYRITCSRVGNEVRLDSQVLATGVSSSWSKVGTGVANLTWPTGRLPALTVGGKLKVTDTPVLHSSDQFNGILDRVRVTIG